MTVQSSDVSRSSPSVTYLDAVPVGASYTVDEWSEAVAPPPFRRNGFVQFALEFSGAVFGLALAIVRFFVGLGMPLGLLAAIAFLILYAFIKVPACLYWAAGSFGLAFVSFTVCYLSGIVQGQFDRFVGKGRA